MVFRTIIDMPDYACEMGYKDKIFTIGSCFADEIYNKMKAIKLDCISNPHGILYNPISIANSLSRVLQGKLLTIDELAQGNGLWFSWDHHGSFSKRESGAALEHMNRDLLKGNKYLSEASYLIITWGSAFVYELKKEGRIVGNCHKQPARTFVKRMLSMNEITKVFTNIIEDILKINPSLKIFITVSPVRHLSEGLIENNRSKAVLINAVHEMVSQLESVYYFPAYEILLDDLRDYRFYSRDLVHPSEEAIAYIWALFQSSLMTEKAISVSDKIVRLQKSVQHKAFHPESMEHQQFLKSVYQKMLDLQNETRIDFKVEMAKIKSQLID